MSIRFGRICNDHCIANFVQSPAVKEIKIYQYFAKLSTRVVSCFFDIHCINNKLK